MSKLTEEDIRNIMKNSKDKNMVEKSEFSDLQFPMVRNINARRMTDYIKGTSPMTIEEAAKGKTIKKFPKKYDDFESIETMLDYLTVDLLSRDYPISWLDVSKTSSMTFGYKDFYYLPSISIAITAYEPVDNPFQDIREGAILIELNPEKWVLEVVENAIQKYKETQTHE